MRIRIQLFALILKFFDADPGPGVDKIHIRDEKKSDSGSGINIPDPEHRNSVD
jgi:hypothetical protein